MPVRRANVSISILMPPYALKSTIHRANGIGIEDPLQALLLNMQILADVWNRNSIARTEPNIRYLGTRACRDDTY